MAKRVALSDDEIGFTLLKAGKSISGAARLLGISTRTLQRRIAENPALKEWHWTSRVWSNAYVGSSDWYSSALNSLRIRSWEAHNHHVLWYEKEHELEPRELTGDEIFAHMRDFDVRAAKVLRSDLTELVPRTQYRRRGRRRWLTAVG